MLSHFPLAVFCVVLAIVSIITCSGSVRFSGSIGSLYTGVPGTTGVSGSGFKTACVCTLN